MALDKLFYIAYTVCMNKDLTQLTGQELRNIQHQFRARLQAGEDYEKVESDFKPYLQEMQRRADLIAKKYGTKPQKMSFRAIMR